MKVLYIEDEEALLSLISMELEAELDCQVVELSSGNQAVHWLETNDCTDIGAIISDHKMADGAGSVVFQFLKEKHPEIPFILTTGSADACDGKDFEGLLTVNPKNSVLLKPFSLEALIDRVKNLLPVSGTPESKKFSRVSHSRIKKTEIPPCDIYIKISETKFIKIINAHERITDEIFDKYLKKGIDYFYVSEKDFPHFSKIYNEKIRLALESAKEEADVIKVQLEGFESIQDYIQNLGLDATIIETISLITKSSIDTIRQNPHLFHLVEVMMSEENYLSEHSMMTGYIAGALALEMDWVTNSTLQKLTTAALLHDAYLADAQLAKISHQNESEWAYSLRPDQIELIKKHTIIMADLIKKTKGIEPDVDIIIFNHHETPDGTGYPRQLTHHQIFPLAALFIVAEDFANTIYDKKPKAQELRLIIENFEKKYSKGNFKKATEALRKVFYNPFSQ